MLRLFRYLKKKEAGYIVFGLIFILTQVWFDLKLPDNMSTITKLVQTEGSPLSSVLKAGGFMLACAFGSLASSIIVGFCVAKIAAGLSMRLREAVYDKVMDFTMEEIGIFSTPSLITRSTNDVTQVMLVIALGMQVLVRAPIMAVMALVKISGKSWQWTTATAIAVVLILALLSIVFSIVIPRFMKIQTLTDNLNRVTRENLSGIRIVRAYNAEEYQEKKFRKANEDLTGNNLFVQRTMAIMQPGMAFIMSCLTLSIYWVGVYMIDAAGMEERVNLFSEMVVFSSYAMQVIMAFMMITITMIILPRASVSAKRIQEVLRTVTRMQDGAATEGAPGVKGKVEFRDVSFRYPDAEGDILHHLTFEANQGETVAIIGSTGSGKSSLINLIPRFFDVSGGEVLVDGVNVKDYQQSALRKKIGYVPQRSTLFSGTIRSNVAYGDSTPGGEEAVQAAIETAQAAEFVSKMEGTVDAPISQGGTNVSGGPRQRLSIARAIYRNPEIYIFDDSFSALDYKTDRVLRKALKEKTKGATILIVAQRIGTIMDADRILVMNEGFIVGQGKHEELLSSCAVYREIAESQLSKEELTKTTGRREPEDA
ncbi:MAG: ABC transporter ATP-binding protein [Lachnospiraceae bacterium]|nr:ABC transporter ATP-binding protein [Lachnospiraceae bacterium]